MQRPLDRGSELRTEEAPVPRPLAAFRRRTPSRAALLVLALLLGPTAQTPAAPPLAAVDPATVGLDGSRLARIDDWLEASVRKGEMVGAVALVARRGQVGYLATVGDLDRERGIPMRVDALFRIASMTKLFTSAAALSLYEDGAFQLDDPVSKFLPELAELEVGTFDARGALVSTRPAAGPIRMRDLLRHTSGLAYDTPDGLGEIYRARELRSGTLSGAEFVKRLARAPLAEDPGTRWRYGLSTDVLGRILEVITGKPLDQVIAQRVLLPLGLADTGFQVLPRDVERLGPIYEWRDDAFVVAEDPRRSPLLQPPIAVSGGGGWGDTGSLGGAVSTAADLLRFLRWLAAGGALDEVRVLEPETVALMTRDHLDGKPSLGPGYGYGLGVGVVTDPTIPRIPMAAAPTSGAAPRTPPCGWIPSESSSASS